MFAPARTALGCILLALLTGRALLAQPAAPAAGFEEHLSGSELAIPEAPLSPEVLPPGRPGLSLESLQQMALDRHPALAEAQARVAAARGNWVQVGLRPNPRLGYMGEEIGDAGSAGKQGAFIAQEFVTGGKLEINRQVARQQILAAEQRLEAERRRVLNDVRLVFYQTLLAQRRLDAAARLADVAQQNVDATGKAVEAQVLNRITLLQAEVQSQTTQTILATAEAAFRSAWRRLAAVSATSDLKPMPLVGDVRGGLPQLDWDIQRTRLLRESPEVAEAAAEVNRTAWAWRRASAQRYPNIETSLALLNNAVNGDTLTTVQLSIPLQFYDRNQGAIAEAAAEHRAASLSLDRLEFSLQGRLAETFRRYDAARAQATRYSEHILPTAQESLDLVQQGFRQGELDYLTLLTAERTYNQAVLTHLAALEEAWEAAIAIEGMLLSNFGE